MGRNGKIWAVAALTATTAALLVGASGCDPADGLSESAVSVTTDQLATHALRSDHVKVQWLSCSASTGRRQVKVDCLGRTEDQQRITVQGTVTEQQDDTCVRGRLTAVAGGRTVFDVGGLGDCVHRTATPS
ncbi:hypothetical protein V2S66_20585 [Streptomyces sp. V4-01]|uniref:Lipoprotein n=1 Tax=Actinacidiphila polyblastidii TaxID=3110430 RepID=A0ABU7PEW5_9ACTN|nr:hypothetical protein [Streptomyces sp. V4-01]